MAITVKHKFVSAIPDAGDTTIVQPSNWNDDHQLSGTVPVANGGTGASTLTGYVKGNGTSAMTAATTVPNTDVTGLGTASTKDAGVANGVATLDSSGQVPLSQIPPLGDLNYQGTWNATTNSPTLTSSVGTKGFYYVVSVAGTTTLNGISDWQIGDWAVFNGSVWQKIDNTDAVTSVNGYTGTVVLTTTDVAEGTNQYFTTARARTSVSAGTGISYDNATGVITNSSPSLGGDVVGPASATDNAIARFDSTTGKLLQNSVVTVSDTGAVTGFTTASASTSVTTPIVQASNSAGLALKNASGTTQMSMGAGGGDNMAINVSTNLNGTNAQIDISPTGTGHVHMKPSGTGSIEIAPTNVGTMDNMTIGATTPKAITGTTVTATSFVGSGASLTNVVNSLAASTGISVSASTGAVTVTNTAPDQTVAIASGTGISVSGTYPNFTVTNTAPSSGGTVTSVTGTAPVVSSGGATPAISMPAATGSVDGYLTSTDWTTFNNKSNTNGTVTSVAALTLGTTGTDLSSTVANGTTTPVITLQVPTASATNRGALSSTDWSTFNGKQVALVSGTNIKTVNGTSLLGSGDVGTIGVSYGGTGLTSLTANYIPYGNGTGAFSSTSAFTYTSTGLGVGTSATSIIDGRVDQASITYLTVQNRYHAPSTTQKAGLKLQLGDISESFKWCSIEAVPTSAYESGAGLSFNTYNGLTPAQGMFINNVGGVQTLNTISVGNATPSASGAGITFPATQSPSTDPNTLDDYEEGTWTPVFSGLTVVGSPSYVGTYTKIGRVVYVNWVILTGGTASTSSIANSTSFSGLPFTIASSGVMSVSSNNISNIGVGVLYSGTTAYTPTWVATTDIIYGTGFYTV